MTHRGNPLQARLLEAMLREAGLPLPKAEYEFSGMGLWRADYAWPRYMLALEVDGGRFVGGRHNRGSSTLSEHKKRNAYAMEGWRVLYRTPQNLLSEETMRLIYRALYA